MLVLSLDIETTGLDPATCQILEIGAVVFDTHGTMKGDEPTFREVLWHEAIHGEPVALAMNAALLTEGKEGDSLDESAAIYALRDFIGKHVTSRTDERVVVAGKNPAFDLAFIRAAEVRHWGTRRPVTGAVHHRTLDPVALYLRPDDTAPPNLQTCLDRAGVDAVRVTHTAVDDALAVALVIQAAFAGGHR